MAIEHKYVEVNGSKIHYVEAGQGNPVLFLHGIPTSSYLWRNIIPHVSTLGHCIAPDLIGFGRSDKPDIEYSISDHIHYIETFITLLGLKKITLIMHGWGSVIGLDYAMRHEKNCNGLVFYEAFLHPLNKDDISLPFQEQLIVLHEEEHLHNFTTDATAFIEKTIPQHVMQKLPDQTMNEYRQPFLRKGSGKPISQYLKELPKGDGKGTVDKLIANYSKKLTSSHVPKLMLYSVPGFLTTMTTIVWAKENLPNLEITELNEEFHLAQESCPDLMGELISVWLQGVEASSIQEV